MRAIVIVILSLVFLLPVLDSDTYNRETFGNREKLNMICELYSASTWNAYQKSIQMLVDTSRSDHVYPIIYADVVNP
jgi:hypothetical protein